MTGTADRKALVKYIQESTADDAFDEGLLNKKRYTNKLCREAVQLMGKGMSDTQLAAYWNMSSEDLEAWKRDHPEFKRALMVGITAFESFWEMQLQLIASGQIKNGNVTACEKILKTRRSEVWNVKEEKKKEIKSAIESMTDEELETALQQILKVSKND
jgi:uncharacterized protein YcaQ